MGLFRVIVEQRVVANLMFLVLLVVGFLAVRSMPVEEYPNVALDKILIVVPWPGAAPEDVERLITRELEEKIQDVTGVEWIQSSSFPERAEIWVKVESDGVDFDSVYRDIQTELSKVRNLPDDAEEPDIRKIDVEEMAPVLHVVIGWDSADKSLPEREVEQFIRGTAKQLEVELEQIPTVKRTRVYGLRDKELRVELDPAQLNYFGLTVGDVARVLRNRNVGLPAGTLKSDQREMTIRGNSELKSLQQFRDVVIRADERGTSIRLRDVASVQWEFEKATVRSFFRGKSCAMLAVVKYEHSNSIEVAKSVRALLPQFQKNLPKSMTLNIVADTTQRVQERIDVLKSNIIIGLVLVLVVLWLTIGLRNAFLGSLGIPFSFLVAFIFLKIGGESINIISLFSMVLVLGVIVDDALVVLENVHRHKEMGKSTRRAVIEGTNEVAIPVISATLTTIAAFLPLLLMPGTTGKFFAIIPKTVCYSLLASLFECLVILPVHILDFDFSESHDAEGDQSGQTSSSEELTTEAEQLAVESESLSLLQRSYERLLRICLGLRYFLVILIGLTAIGAIFVLGRIPVVFFPSDFKQFNVNIQLPVGSDLSQTQATALKCATLVEGMPTSLIESCLVNAGFYYDSNYKLHTEPRFAQLFITTASAKVRNKTVQEIMAELRVKLSDLGLVGTKIEVIELSDGPPIGKPVTIRLRGDNLKDLQAQASRTMGLLSEIKGVSNIDIDLKGGRDEITFKLDDSEALRHGISAEQVSLALAFANDGAVLTQWKSPDEDEPIDVRVRYQTTGRATTGALESIKVRNRHGALVSLGEVTNKVWNRSLSAIQRYNNKRSLTISADINILENTAVQAIEEFKRKSATSPAIAGIVTDFEGEFAETNKSFASLQISFILAIGCIFMVLGAQFKSFLQPFVVLFTVPFAFIGVAYGLWLIGDPFTMTSGIAIVGLAGMVVNDSLVLVDFVNQLKREGLNTEDALIIGARNRVRAILLTTVTTVFGVLPMALGVGGRSPVWSPMATSIAFGLSFATILTLFVIPSFYYILDDYMELKSRLWARLLGSDEAED